MKTVILCGGKGSRAYPYTRTVPKPLLEVDGDPVLLHVMRIFARQGFEEFVLSAGYKAELVAEFATTCPPGWDVEVVDTGVGTNTAGRITGVRDRVGEVFMATYADGLGDVDLRALVDGHRQSDAGATMTIVPLPSPYGTVEIDPGGDTVVGFHEKPLLKDYPINAGFFVFDLPVLDRFVGDDLENEVLPALAAAGELRANRHDGYWKSMDTYKDAVALTALHRAGDAPWARGG